MTHREEAFADSVKELIGAIAYQAVQDWIDLDYGRIETMLSEGEPIRRSEVYSFLVSDEFAAFVTYVCPGISMNAVWQRLTPQKGREMTGIEGLTKTERETLLLMANNGMNVTRVARAGFSNRTHIYEHLRNIKLKTGVDPMDFWGLLKRLMMIREEKEKCKNDAENAHEL